MRSLLLAPHTRHCPCIPSPVDLRLLSLTFLLMSPLLCCGPSFAVAVVPLLLEPPLREESMVQFCQVPSPC